MNDTLAERTQRYLLASTDEMEKAHLPAPFQARMLRLREMYAVWLKTPRLADRDIVRILQNKYRLGTSQAYEDVRLIKICLGSLGRLTRDYDRYIFRLRCEEGWQMAREQNDPRAFAATTATYLKGTQLDHPDSQRPNYNLIQPQQFIISTDPAASGFKPVPGILEKAKRLQAQYLQEIRKEDTTAAHDNLTTDNVEELPTDPPPRPPKKPTPHDVTP